MVSKKFSKLLSLILAVLCFLNPFDSVLYATNTDVTQKPQKLIDDGNGVIVDKTPLPSDHGVNKFKQLRDLDATRLAEYISGGVVATGLLLTTIFMALPKNIEPLVNEFLNSGDLETMDRVYSKMGGTQEFIVQYNQFCAEHNGEIEDAYKLFSPTKYSDNYDTWCNPGVKVGVTFLRDKFPINSLNDAYRKQISKMHYVYWTCPVFTAGRRPYFADDVYTFLLVYLEFMEKNNFPADGLDKDTEAKAAYIFYNFMCTSDEIKNKLRTQGHDRYYKSRLFSDVPPNERIDPSEILDKYLGEDNKPNVSFDEWVRILGVTDQNIKNYKQRCNTASVDIEDAWRIYQLCGQSIPTGDGLNKDAVTADFSEKTEHLAKNSSGYKRLQKKYSMIEQLKKDILRTNNDHISIVQVDKQNLTSCPPKCEEQFFRILYLYYTQDETNLPTGQFDYGQGENSILLMSYYKCVIGTNDFDHVLSLDNEAKVYCVFSKLMHVLYSFKKQYGNTDTISQAAAMINQGIPQRFGQIIPPLYAVDYMNLLNSPYFGMPLADVYFDLCTNKASFTTDAYVSLWDRIITDSDMYQGTSLDADKVLNTISNVVLSSIVVSCGTRSKNNRSGIMDKLGPRTLNFRKELFPNSKSTT